MPFGKLTWYFAKNLCKNANRYRGLERPEAHTRRGSRRRLGGRREGARHRSFDGVPALASDRGAARGAALRTPRRGQLRADGDGRAPRCGGRAHGGRGPVAVTRPRRAGPPARRAFRVTSSETLAYRLLTRHMAAFRAAYPGVTVELAIDNRVLSLTRREADVALRPMHRRKAISGAASSPRSPGRFTARSIISPSGRLPRRRRSSPPMR